MLVLAQNPLPGRTATPHYSRARGAIEAKAIVWRCAKSVIEVHSPSFARAHGSTSDRKEPLKVGWREWVGLPDLRVDAIKAKIDTGARTSALHAYNIEPFRRGGALWLRFELHPMQRSEAMKVICEARAVDERTVRNSGGGVERRYIIRTLLKLGEKSWPIELALANRDQMGFRMLLGRTALQGPRADRARPLLSVRRAAARSLVRRRKPTSSQRANRCHKPRPLHPRHETLMKIALLARNPHLYSHRRICEAARARGHEIEVINTLRVSINITSRGRPCITASGGWRISMR